MSDKRYTLGKFQLGGLYESGDVIYRCIGIIPAVILDPLRAEHEPPVCRAVVIADAPIAERYKPLVHYDDAPGDPGQ